MGLGNLFFKERRTTVSLLSQDYLIAEASHGARQEQEQIDAILKEMRAGNFSRLEEFETLINKIFENIQENIKLYTEREEHERLEILEQVIHEFFQRHLFAHIDDHLIYTIQKNFREKLRVILKELMNEKKIERRLKHGRRPANAYFRKLFFENKQLNQHELNNARELLQLHKEEETTREHLYRIIQILSRPKGLDTAHEKHHEERLFEAFTHFIIIVAQEFHALYDIDVDVALHEADLLHELNWVLKQKNISKEHKKKIKALKKKIHRYFTKDIRAFKRLLREEKKEHKQVEQFDEEKEREDKEVKKPSSWEENTNDNETKRDVLLIMDKIIEIKEAQNSKRVAGLILLADGAYKTGRNAAAKEKNSLGELDFRHAETDMIIQAIHDNHDPRDSIMYVSDVCCLRKLKVNVLEDTTTKQYQVIGAKHDIYEFTYHAQEMNKDIYIFKTGKKTMGPRWLEQKDANTIIVHEKYIENGLGIYVPRMLIYKEGTKAIIVDGCAFMNAALGVKKVYFLHTKNDFYTKETKLFMEQGVLEGEKIFPEAHTKLIKKNEAVLEKVMGLAKQRNLSQGQINEMKKLAEEYRRSQR